MDKPRTVVKKTLASVGLGISDTVATVFRFRFTNSPERAASYAFMYSTREEDVAMTRPAYFCCSPSLLSKDGEYRSRFLPMSSLQEIEKAHPWKDVVDFVSRETGARNWNYYSETYLQDSPHRDKILFEIDSEIGRRNLAVVFLAITWFTELFNKLNGLEVNHVNPQFTKISGLQDELVLRRAKSFYTGLIRRYGIGAVRHMRSVMNVEFVDGVPVKMGQKLVPLNLTDVQRPMDIRQKPWKELLISRRVQDLVVSGISSGFPLVGPYFYIHDAQTDLFDNSVQYLKIDHSKTAVGIVRKLLEAQRAAWYTMEGTGSSSPSGATGGPAEEDKDAEAVRRFLADKFFSLYRKIGDPIEFTKNEFIMSNIILAAVSEYVGRSFYDFLLLNLENEYYAKETGHPFKSPSMFAKYMFEVLFAMYCANTRLGLIHGDLHLNNCTVHPIFFSDKKEVSDNAAMQYTFGKTTLTFASRQYHSVVIDFSRSLIRPSAVADYEPEEQKRSHGRVRMLPKAGRPDFFREQASRILLILESAYPHIFSKNKTVVELAVHSHFEDLFPALTAVDAMRFADEVDRFLTLNKMGSTKQAVLSRTIKEMAEKKLETALVNFLDEGPRALDNVPFVLGEILEGCFSQFSVSPKDKKILMSSNVERPLVSASKTQPSAFSNRARQLEKIAQEFEQRPLG